MTNIQEQDARLIAMDVATVAAIRMHAPEFEAAYLDDNLPRWFQRLLVPRHSDYDRLILSQSRMGMSSGATRISMLRGTPG